MFKYILLLAFTSALIVAGCKKDNADKPKPPSVINFTKHNIFPEGLAFDVDNSRFFVSSASLGTIGSVNYSGVWSSVITDPELVSTTGLKIDKSHQRLWVCNVAGGIGAYDITNGNKLFYTDLSALTPGQSLFINDEAIDPNGNVYVTSSDYPVIFKIDVNGNPSVFFQNSAFAVNPGEFGFNGIQYDARGFLLVAHTAMNQIIKIPVGNPSNFTTVALNAPISFPDGMLLSRSGNQLVLVSDDHVLSFNTQDQWQTASQSTSYLTGPVFATSLTSDGNRVYVVYCHLDKLLSGQDQDTYTIQEVTLSTPDTF